MSELGFKQIKFSGTITVVSENGKVADVEDIKDFINDALDGVFDDAVDNYNNVIKYEVLDSVEIANGSDSGN